MDELMNQPATSVRNHCLSPTRATVAIDAPLGLTAYGRMFPELPSFEADEQFLRALGRGGGICDCGDVPDALLRIHKIKRGPILVIKSAPNRMVVIDRNRIGNMHVFYCPANVVDGFLKGELGRMDADRDQTMLYIFSRPTRGRKAAGAASRCRDTSRNQPERLSRATRCSSVALN
jgi:hypothetical protein